MIIALKLLLTPFLMSAVTLISRRWGNAVSGFLIGLPLTSGPISFILAYEYGLNFASKSSVGSLAGQISNCIFALIYVAASRSLSWKASSAFALMAFFASTFVLSFIQWELWLALFVLLVFVLISAKIIKHHHIPLSQKEVPRWDLPGRVLCATALVLILTSIADKLGPQLSGLIAPFPAFILIFSAFSHSHLGARSASNFLRGVVIGSGGYAVFFTVIGSKLEDLGLAKGYLLASLSAVVVGAIVYFISKKKTFPDSKVGI